MYTTYRRCPLLNTTLSRFLLSRIEAIEPPRYNSQQNVYHKSLWSIIQPKFRTKHRLYYNDRQYTTTRLIYNKSTPNTRLDKIINEYKRKKAGYSHEIKNPEFYNIMKQLNADLTESAYQGNGPQAYEHVKSRILHTIDEIDKRLVDYSIAIYCQLVIKILEIVSDRMQQNLNNHVNSYGKYQDLIIQINAKVVKRIKAIFSNNRAQSERFIPIFDQVCKTYSDSIPIKRGSSDSVSKGSCSIELYQLVNGYVKELDIKPTGTMISSLVLAFIKGLRINDALNLLQVSKRQKLRLPVETGSQIIELIKEIIDDLNTKKMLDGSNSEFVCSVRNLIRDYYGINLIDRPYISGQQIDRNSHFDKDYKVLSNRYLTISESTSFQTLLSIPWLFTSIDDIEAIWYFCDNNNNNKSQNLLKSIESQLTYLKAIDRVLEAHNGNSDITNTKADQKRVWRLLVNYRLYYIKNNKPKKSNHNIGTSTRMVIKSDILLTMMKIATKTVSTDDSYMLVDWLIDYSTDNLKQQKTSYPSNGYKDATTNLEMMKNYIDALRYVIDRLESDYWKLRIEKDNSRLLIVNSRGLDKVKTVTKNGIATRKRKRSRLNQNALIGGKQLIIENGVNQLWYHYNKYWATSSLDCIENANSGSIDQVILDMKLNLGRIFVSCFGDTEKCFKILDDLSTSAPRKASNDNSKMMDLGLQISECFVGYPRLYLEYIERSKPKLLTMMDHIDSNSIGIGLIDIISTWKQWNEYKYQIFGHLLSSSFKDISWDKVESALVIMICRILKHSKTCRIGIPEYPIGIPSSLESHYHDVAINVFMKQIDTGMSLTEEIEVKTWAKHVCEALSKPDDLVLDTLNL